MNWRCDLEFTNNLTFQTSYCLLVAVVKMIITVKQVAMWSMVKQNRRPSAITCLDHKAWVAVGGLK